MENNSVAIWEELSEAVRINNTCSNSHSLLSNTFILKMLHDKWEK